MGYNPHNKWPYTWPCSFNKSVVGDSSKEWIFDGGSLIEVERPSEDDLSRVVFFPRS